MPANSVFVECSSYIVHKRLQFAQTVDLAGRRPQAEVGGGGLSVMSYWVVVSLSYYVARSTLLGSCDCVVL